MDLKASILAKSHPTHWKLSAGGLLGQSVANNFSDEQIQI